MPNYQPKIDTSNDIDKHRPFPKRHVVQKKPAGRRKWGLGIPIMSVHITNDMNSNMNIDNNIHIDITRPTHAEAVRRRGRGGKGGYRLGWGHIKILYKALEEYTKPQNIIQRHKTLRKDLI